MPSPVLRWAGGKTWLSPLISNLFSASGMSSYVEPFLGGGATLFSIAPSKSAINDINPDLINLYRSIKTNPELLLSYLHDFPLGEKSYYEIRNIRFSCRIQEAARFLYLNRTCFGGIHRVNRQGDFNVPYGHKKTLGSCINSDNLKSISTLLRRSKISSLDFSKVLEAVKSDSFIYCDPVYTSTDNQRFDRYNSDPFTLDCHRRLASSLASILASTGSIAVVSLPYDSVFLPLYERGIWIGLARNSRFGLGKRMQNTHFELLWIAGFQSELQSLVLRAIKTSGLKGYDVIGYTTVSINQNILNRWRIRHVLPR